MIPEIDDVSSGGPTLEGSCGEFEVGRAVPVTRYAVIILCGVVVVISS